MTKDGRIRLFELCNYDEFWKPTKALAWLEKQSCKYIAVIHDKDVKDDGTPKGKHYHIAVSLKNARTLEEISKFCDIEKQYITIKAKFKDTCAYLFHLTSKARLDHKHEYDESALLSCKGITYEEVVSNSIAYDNNVKRDALMKQLLYKYGNCEITKSEIMKSMTAEDYDRYGLTFRKMKEYRIMKVRERAMKVIYITGESGSGKTTLAKYMAKVMNYDYFVSGSGKDVLDGYDKEECIILDDLRADVFTKAELFKLTDNNTNSSVKSRFQNKDISYCKLMIITSIKAPHNLYCWNTDTYEDKDETFKQFSRRLGNTFIQCESDGSILERTYFDDKITTKLQDFNMSQVFAVLGFEKRIGSDVMSEIFQRVSASVEKDKARYEKEEDLPF